MKFLFLTIFICSVLLSANGQAAKILTLEECYRLARKNYPLIQQKELIAKSKQYLLENASTAWLPRLSINGQASYQSDVTEIPIKIPNTTVPSISKDQYKIYTDVNQVIFDGGIIKMQRQSIEANAAVEDQELEVQLYNLKERINQLFFGILLLNEQDSITKTSKNDIRNGLAKINASIANGTALKSSADVLQADLLKADQHILELKATANAYVEILSRFINQPLDENILLVKPVHIPVTQNMARPELLLFEKQKKLVDVQNSLLKAKNKPAVSLFVQAGFGRPALNMLKNDFTGYYVGGIRFNWSLSGFYTYKREKTLLENNRRSTDIQEETFLFNTTNALQQQKAEILRLQDAIESDKEIIALRNRIKNTAMAQLEFGVINSADYLREVNAWSEARQNQLLHEIQLLMAEYNHQTTSGN
jgi:outer membrane protein TolC